jgi:hypothetical protein
LRNPEWIEVGQEVSTDIASALATLRLVEYNGIRRGEDEEIDDFMNRSIVEEARMAKNTTPERSDNVEHCTADEGAIPAPVETYMEYHYKRTNFIRDLTRELFMERAKAAPSGKISPDYAKYALEGATSVADVLGLED